ncbi:MAG: PDZ domain-containing protein [Bacilli bacterium]|nr:PDZ domain-containing protein [Bacilli bacterium]
MKKYIIAIICSMMIFPGMTLAYSDYIIPGGETLGIDIKSEGIMIIGFYKINGKYNKGELRVGDYITKINGEDVTSLEQLTTKIENNVSKKKIIVTYTRKGKTSETAIDLIYDNNIYKTGLYVKDSITGIGTLTYIDPNTKIYGALGHEIMEKSTNSIVEIKTGTIFENRITSINKSINGNPGSKNAEFNLNNIYGDIKKNTKYGIYGNYSALLPQKETLEVAEIDEVEVGEAFIYTVLENQKVEKFSISINSINEDAYIKNLIFSITDERLIEKTGGVVQGMSGSPIIQNDKIIGAVTHVIVDDVLSGYGIFITTMLVEGEN